MVAADRRRKDRALDEPAQHAHRFGQRLELERTVAEVHPRVERDERRREQRQRERPARELVRAAEGDDAGDLLLEHRCRRVGHETAEGVAHQVHGAVAGEPPYLLDGGGDVFIDEGRDGARRVGPEVPRAAVPAQLEVEHVEPGLGEVVEKAP